MPNVRAALADPLKVNYDYGYKGALENKPVSVADDGTKTFFEFSGEVPGIFAVESDGSETLVNYRREGNYIFVDKVNRQWTLRSGSVTTCVFNMKLTGKRTVAANSLGGRTMTGDPRRTNAHDDNTYDAARDAHEMTDGKHDH